MYRYKMGRGISGIGVLLFIAALILIVLGLSQLLRPGTGTPDASGDASAPTFTQTVRNGWDSGVASLKRLWQLLTNQDGLQGSGEDTDTDAVDAEEEAQPVQVDVVQQAAPAVFKPIGSDVQVIIYSTHTHEAFTKTDGQNYDELAQWRTDNNDYNIVKVGEALAQELSDKYGIGVVQDKTDTEIPVLATSYSRSLVVAKQNIAEYPDVQIVIDLHRDAWNANIDPNVATVDGVKAARVMFVIGTGEGQTGVGFTERPDWKRNMALAQTINENLKAISPLLSRDISVKKGRYNQHLSPGCVLIEVGNNKNTLEEVLATVPYLAQAIAKTLESMPVAATAATTSPTPSPEASTTTAGAQATATTSDVVVAPGTLVIEPIIDGASASPSPSPSSSPAATPSSRPSVTATVTPSRSSG